MRNSRPRVGRRPHLIIMAVAMTLALTAGLGARANEIRRQAPVAQLAA